MRLSKEQSMDLLKKFKGNTSKAAKSIGVPRTTFQGWATEDSKRSLKAKSKTPFKEEEEWEASENRASLIRSIDSPCRTVEEVIAKIDVDMGKWEVEKFKCVSNKWDMGCIDKKGNPGKQPLIQWKLYVWFKRKHFDVDEAINISLEEMKKASPQWPDLPHIKRRETGRTAEFCVFDLHLGKLCWEDETGQDQNLHTAYDIGLKTVQEMSNRCGKVDKVLFPIGNDFLHIDTLFSTTTAGTRQDVDGRPHKVFKMGHKLICEQIKTMAQIAPVQVITVPGNHDMMSAFHLGICAEAYFDNCPHITFNNEPTFRKYVRIGKTLVGFSHQSKEDPKLTDLPMVMAQENRSNGNWGATEWAEFHTAHMHKKRRVDYVACQDKTGVVVYTIPSICATDAWHAQKGFIHWNRCAELRTFDHEYGPEGIINIYPGMCGL